MRYMSAPGSGGNRGGRFSFSLQGSGRTDLQKSENMNKKIKYKREKHTSISESETSIGASTDF